MNLNFYMLILSFLLFVFIVYINKEVKGNLFIFFLGITWTFFTSTSYYYLGGESYKIFSNHTLDKYAIYSCIILFITTLMIILKNFLILNLKRVSDINLDNKFIKIYFFSIITFTFSYILLHFKDFPFINLILTGNLIERADTTGAIPHFKTFSLVAFILFPSIYFYYYKNINSKFLHFLFLSVITFILIIGGHKGVVVFFFIFIWVYIYKMKLNLKLLVVLIFLLAIYTLSKGILEYNEEFLSYIASSPLRRFFVTQGAGFIVRMDLIENGFIFNETVEIKRIIFNIIYGDLYIGSHPTFFIGDLYVRYGYYTSLLIFSIVCFFIVVYSKIIQYKYENNLFILWNWYNFLLLLCLAEISYINVFTYLLVFFNIYFILFVRRYTFVKKNY